MTLPSLYHVRPDSYDLGYDTWLRKRGELLRPGSYTAKKLTQLQMTAAFLEFSKSRGNDLSTPMPAFGFPGLKPGDRWCLCAPRWQEAFEANQAPRVVLRATHEGAIAYCSLADLKRFAVDLA